MRRLLFTIFTIAGTLMPVFGQQDDDASRGVARVSVIAGDVSVRRGDSGDNVAATLNAPLVAQDSLSTGPGARAEVQFDYANMARLGANTEIRLAELQSQRFQLNLAGGLMTYRVWQNSNAEVDINTPVASIRPMRKGEYRVQVLEDGTTEVTVRDGEVDIYTPQGSRRLGEGRTLTIRREGNGEPNFQTSAAIPMDSWDQWNRNRDRELSASRSNQYLPQGVYGGEQLDNYGDWTYSAPYGYVWSPRVASGWAPYRTGRWSWLDWYGWSWVSYDPWGWAPYHYGRWFNNGGRWCWWPGATGSRHYWSPGLVSFVGFGGGGLGFGFGWGNVGWVPLAPFETYNRWYGRNYYGNRNYNNITVVNNVNITNIYRNARVDGGVSYVEAQNFNRGNAYTGGNNSGVRAARMADLNNASEFRGPVGIAPTRDSVRYAAGDDGVRGRNNLAGSRTDQNFTSRRQAASVERVPFDTQRQRVEQMARTSGVMRAEDGVRGGNPANSGAANSNTDGFRRLGERNADGMVRRENGAQSGAPLQGSRGQSSDNNPAGQVQRTQGVRGGEGFVQRESPRDVQVQGGVQNGVRGGGADVNRTDGVRGNGQSGSGWQRFGDADVNSGARGSGRSSDGFVQRDNGSRSGGTTSIDLGSRSRGVGAVDVSPRIVERGSQPADNGSRGNSQSVAPQQNDRGNSGSVDSFGSRSRGGDSGWGAFGGVRGNSNSGNSNPTPRVEQSTPRSMPDSGRGNSGNFNRGGGGSPAPQMSSPRMSAPAPQMSAPSGGGGSRGGGVSAPSGGGGGGARGGGSAPASQGGGGGNRGGGGGRGRNQ